jgi:hypothetical protein
MTQIAINGLSVLFGGLLITSFIVAIGVIIGSVFLALGN